MLVRSILRAAQRLDPEIDQVGGADVLDDGEGQRGRGEQRGQSEGRGQRVAEVAHGDGGNRTQPDAHPLAQRPGDQIQHRRPGCEGENDTGDDESHQPRRIR